MVRDKTHARTALDPFELAAFVIRLRGLRVPLRRPSLAKLPLVPVLTGMVRSPQVSRDLYCPLILSRLAPLILHTLKKASPLGIREATFRLRTSGSSVSVTPLNGTFLARRILN